MDYSKGRTHQYVICVYVWTFIALSFSTYLIWAGNNYDYSEDQFVIKSSLELPADWQTVPFTDITVIGQEDNCPSGTESVFERDWYGMTIGCLP